MEWFENGILQNDQKILALILETKIMNRIESEKEKNFMIPKKEKSNFWLGCSLDYFAPNLVSGEPKGVYLNP